MLEAIHRVCHDHSLNSISSYIQWDWGDTREGCPSPTRITLNIFTTQYWAPSIFFLFPLSSRFFPPLPSFSNFHTSICLEQLFSVTGSIYSSVFLLPCSVIPFYLSSLTAVQVLFEQQLHSKDSSTQRRLFILNSVLSSSILLTFGGTIIGRKRLLIKTSTSVNHLIPIVPLFIYLFDFFSYISRAMDSLRKIRKHTHTPFRSRAITYVCL